MPDGIAHPHVDPVHILGMGPAVFRSAAIDVDQQLSGLGASIQIDFFPVLRRPELDGHGLFGICPRDAFVEVEAVFIRLGQGVDQSIYHGGWARGLNQVGVSSLVDHPAMMGEAPEADAVGGRAPLGHLLHPEIGAIGEVAGRS